MYPVLAGRRSEDVKIVPSELACDGDLDVSTAATRRLGIERYCIVARADQSATRLYASRATPPARRRSASHSWTPESDMADDRGTRLSDLAAAIPPDCRMAQGCSARAGGWSDPVCGKPAIL